MSSLMNLNNFVWYLEEWGIRDVLLPFLLIFIVIYAVLQKTNILGEGKKRMNLAFAIILALIVVIPHVTNSYPSENLDPVVIINSALPAISIVIVAVIMLLILIGVFGGEASWKVSSVSGWITIISLAIIVIIFGAAAGWWGSWDWLLNVFGSDTLAIIIILLVFGVIVAFIAGGEEKEEKEKGKFLNDLGDFFKK